MKFPTAIIILLASVLTNSAHAGDNLKYNQADAIHAEQLATLQAGTDACMSDAVQAELQNGIRLREVILGFVACGRALADFLVSVGRPQKEASSFVHLMAERKIFEFAQ